MNVAGQVEFENESSMLTAKGWLSTTGPAFQSHLFSKAKAFSRARGETLFYYGDPAGGLFGIAKGVVSISVPRDDGVLVPVSNLGSGFWIGDLAALSGRTGLVSIDVREDVTGLHVPAAAIRQLVANCPDYYEEFYKLSRINLTLALRLLAASTAATTREKVAMRIAILSQYSDTTEGWIMITSEELADQLGVSTQSVQRALHKLSEDGLIERRYSRIRMINSLETQTHED